MPPEPEHAPRRAATRPAAVLWDMDGTLVDTEPYWMECERELVDTRGNGRWSNRHAREIVGLDLRDAASYIAEHGEVPMSIDDIVNTLLDGVIERVGRRVPWRPGARELLRDLHRAGVPCALVTMSWHRFADAVVQALPAGTFAAVVTGDEVAHGKPHPEPYLTAAKRLGVAARHCVALEDSPTGVRSALAAGCTVFGIPNAVDIPDGLGHTRVESLHALDLRTLAEAVPTAMPFCRRRMVVAGSGLALALAATAFIAVRGGDDPRPAPPDIAVDAWAPYWALDRSMPSLAENGDWIREVSPFGWYEARGATSIVTADHAPPTDDLDAFVSRAHATGAKVVPSIVDKMSAGGMAAVLADPATRSQHVGAIVDLVRQKEFDGIDLDYEQFAFADGRASWATTSPNWIAFLRELAGALHGDGRTLTVSVPAVYPEGSLRGPGYTVYDYAAMGDIVDHIRVMAYDEHIGAGAPGPIASMAFVEEAVAGAKAAVDDDSKLVLGIALHGYNWPIATSGTCPEGSDSGSTTVSQASLPDLLARRGGTPVHDPVTGEASFTYEVTFSDASTSCTQAREVHYVDEEGARLRIDLARRERLGGVALYALGYDTPATWSAIGSLAASPTSSPTTLVE